VKNLPHYFTGAFEFVKWCRHGSGSLATLGRDMHGAVLSLLGDAASRKVSRSLLALNPTMAAASAFSRSFSSWFYNHGSKRRVWMTAQQEECSRRVRMHSPIILSLTPRLFSSLPLSSMKYFPKYTQNYKEFQRHQLCSLYFPSVLVTGTVIHMLTHTFCSIG
jgi:hypothetical protein